MLKSQAQGRKNRNTPRSKDTRKIDGEIETESRKEILYK